MYQKLINQLISYFFKNKKKNWKNYNLMSKKCNKIKMSSLSIVCLVKKCSETSIELKMYQKFINYLISYYFNCQKLAKFFFFRLERDHRVSRKAVLNPRIKKCPKN